MQERLHGLSPHNLHTNHIKTLFKSVRGTAISTGTEKKIENQIDTLFKHKRESQELCSNYWMTTSR